ncbi:hypothetical protein [Staphylococcus felis]|uniref:Uncharacterized protein n=1 Tax=Staphylococcus felis TaxID=46127 RepID=A0ABS0QN27_9STAP|nr:hypothetical protein [Staphylococcus felis]MBH9580083.1 hypothetical protein [Staphylococcus felis]
MYIEIESLNETVALIDERHTDIVYNGGFKSDDDPMDYVSLEAIICVS